MNKSIATAVTACFAAVTIAVSGTALAAADVPVEGPIAVPPAPVPGCGVPGAGVGPGAGIVVDATTLPAVASGTG